MSSREGPNASSTVRAVQNPEYKQYPQYKHPKYLQYSRVPKPGNTASTRRTYSENAASIPSTPVAPTESNLLQLAFMGPSVNVFCKTIGKKLPTRCTDGPTMFHAPEHFGHIECILVLRVPTDELLAVLTIPAVQNPDLLEAQGVSAETNPETLRV